MTTVCFQLQDRLNFDEPWVDVRSCFHPKNALSGVFHQNHENLNDVFDAFPNLVTAEEDRTTNNSEWARLLAYTFNEEISDEKQADVFWNKMARYTDPDGNLLFINMADFAISVLLIPNSNASAERVFSKQNLEKTRPRNRLLLVSLAGLMKASAYVSLTGGLFNFIITDNMLKTHLKLRRSRTARTRKGRRLVTTQEDFSFDEQVLNAAREEDRYYRNLRSGKRKRRRIEPGPLGTEERNGFNYSDNCDKISTYNICCCQQSQIITMSNFLIFVIIHLNMKITKIFLMVCYI